VPHPLVSHGTIGLGRGATPLPPPSLLPHFVCHIASACTSPSYFTRCGCRVCGVNFLPSDMSCRGCRWCYPMVQIHSSTGSSERKHPAHADILWNLYMCGLSSLGFSDPFRSHRNLSHWYGSVMSNEPGIQCECALYHSLSLD
jgi:hypothetical protein